MFDGGAGLAGTLLNPSQQLFLPTFDELEIALGGLGPLLFQSELGEVPVTLEFECRHNGWWVDVRSSVMLHDLAMGCSPTFRTLKKHGMVAELSRRRAL